MRIHAERLDGLPVEARHHRMHLPFGKTGWDAMEVVGALTVSWRGKFFAIKIEHLEEVDNEVHKRGSIVCRRLKRMGQPSGNNQHLGLHTESFDRSDGYWSRIKLNSKEWAKLERMLNGQANAPTIKDRKVYWGNLKAKGFMDRFLGVTDIVAEIKDSRS